MPLAKRIAIIAGALVALILITGGIAIALIAGAVDRGREELLAIDQAEGVPRVVEYEGDRYEYNDAMVSLLFLGIDTENGRLVEGTSGQADAVMLLALNTSNGALSCIAIPRETTVPVSIQSPDGKSTHETETYLCLVHNEGTDEVVSSERMCQTVSDLLDGVPISDFYTLDLSGIGELVNAVGGLDLTALSDVPEAGIIAGQDVHLEGDMARDYVWRRDWENDDFSPADRLARQRQFIECFADKTLQQMKMNPLMLLDLYEVAKAHSNTNLSLAEISYLASVLSEQGTANINIMTIPGTMTPMPNGPTKYLPDAAGITQMVLDVFYTRA